VKLALHYEQQRRALIMMTPITEGLKALHLPSLKVPLFCVVGAQLLQYLHSIQYRAAENSSLISSPALLAVSLVKIISVVVLAIYVARQLMTGDGRWYRVDQRVADKYLAYILFINIAFASVLVAYTTFLNSEYFETFARLGVTEKAAKVALLLIVLLVAAPLNKAAFRDISNAIGSHAADALSVDAMPAINKRFLLAFVKNGLVCLLPAFSAHVLLFTLPVETVVSHLLVAVVDALLVAALSIAGGLAMFLAHKEAIASEAFSAA
jgi:hypothetical protein